MNKFFEFISRKKIPLWVFLAQILLVLLAYPVWELYWFMHRGYDFVKWHTHLMLYFYIWLAGFGIFLLVSRKKFSETSIRALLFFSAIIFGLFIAEAYFVISGANKTYLEKVVGYYVSPYHPQDHTYYHSWPPNKPHWIEKPEYRYWRPTNSWGLPDKEWRPIKKPNEKRILALGDSFTEGDGAPYDSSYVALLNQKLLAAGDTFYVMNAGVCGSDPFFNYIDLKNRLLVYQPDVVIQTISTNDLNTDIILRGGMERFQKDGSRKFYAAPWWEPVYAISYMSRIFFKRLGYNELLRKEGLKPEEVNRLNEQAIDLFKRYSALCRENNIRLFIILRPDKSEIEKNKYDYDFTAILHELKTGEVEVIDLLPSYRAYLEKHHTDTTPYFWKHDGHHNSNGYEMMAQTIFDNLTPRLKEPVVTGSR